MTWMVSHRFDPRACVIADRHYNRQKIGSPQFVPPGMCIVLLSNCLKALWVSSWPDYARHKWCGAWMNTLFRNEGAGVSSQLIKEAIDITNSMWNIPELGMVTFVDPRYVKPTKVRGKDVFGFCYSKAGFKHVGFTEVHKLWVWQLSKEAIECHF